MPRGPLSNSYPGAVALVVFSLIPFLALTAAVFPLASEIGKSLGLSPYAMDVTIAMSTAGYATGTVFAVQFALHLPARRMLVLYESLFVVASVLAAAAPTGAVFIGAFVTQGLCTSLMLIAAVPPLVTRWPAEKMPTTGMIMNLCIFGAVAVGPTVGAAQLAGGSWRDLFWGVAAVAALALLFSLLTYEDVPPLDKQAPVDVVALLLALVGSGSTFFGAGDLEATHALGVESLLPLVGGFALIVGLVAYQFRRREPLMPVKQADTTVPVTGIYVALMASAAAFGVMELVLLMLRSTSTPGGTALLFLPEFFAAVLVAGLFGALFRTRFTPVLALGGLVAVVAAAALFIAAGASSGVAIGVGTGLLGLGVGASVSPSLFMAGFSMLSPQLPRIFAMIELMRAVTAFLVAPILVYLVSVLGATQRPGFTASLWICLGIAAAGFAGGTLLYTTGKRRLETPDLDRWLEGDTPAWSSPKLFDALGGRARHGDDGGDSGRSTTATAQRREMAAPAGSRRVGVEEGEVPAEEAG